MVVNKSNQLICSMINMIMRQEVLDQLEATWLLTIKCKTNRVAETKVKDRHARVIGIVNGPRIPRLAKTVLTEHEQARFMSFNIGCKLLPKPNRHMFQGINPESINSHIKPVTDWRFYIMPVFVIRFIKRSQPAHFAVNQLILILPVRNLAIVIIETLFVMIVVTQKLSVVIDNAFGSINIWRTVVADDVKDQLDARRVEGFNELLKGG